MQASDDIGGCALNTQETSPLSRQGGSILTSVQDISSFQDIMHKPCLDPCPGSNFWRFPNSCCLLPRAGVVKFSEHVKGSLTLLFPSKEKQECGRNYLAGLGNWIIFFHYITICKWLWSWISWSRHYSICLGLRFQVTDHSVLLTWLSVFTREMLNQIQVSPGKQ